MDAHKVLEGQCITAETLYKTYIREANDVVFSRAGQREANDHHLPHGCMCSLVKLPNFTGASALESELAESGEFDGQLKKGQVVKVFRSRMPSVCQCRVLNEFEIMWQLRMLFPLHFCVFNETVCHLSAEANVEQVFSRAGQLSIVNLHPDSLADMG